MASKAWLRRLHLGHDHGECGEDHDHEHEEEHDHDHEGGDEVLGFMVALGAGLATMIGAFAAIFVRHRQKEALACGLAAAAGAMLYVTFTHIYTMGLDFFQEDGMCHDDATLVTNLIMFGVIICTALADIVFRRLGWRTDANALENTVSAGGGSNAEDEHPASQEPTAKPAGAGEKKAGDDDSGTSLRPAEQRSMMQTALFTAIAMTLHNLPEGLLNFIAVAEDTQVGFAVATAIAFHNIPEGMAVALPVIAATGSKWKALGLAFCSAMSEPLGGLLAWIALKEVIGPLTHALIASVTAGIMIQLSLFKLLPAAIRLEPEGRLTPWAAAAGALCVAVSTVALEYA